MEVLLCNAHVFEHRIPRHHVYHLDEPIEVFGAAPTLDEQLNLVRDKTSRDHQINSRMSKNDSKIIYKPTIENYSNLDTQQPT